MYRLLETLEEEGYVARSASDNRFRVTKLVMSLSVGYNAANSISQVTGPVIVELSQRFIWPFDMSVRDDTMMVVQESTHPRSPLTDDRRVIGRRLPIFEPQPVAVSLHIAPQRSAMHILHQIRSAPHPEDVYHLREPALMRMLEETVKRGYSTRYSERYNPHTSSIAVPIFSGTTLLGSMAVIWITKALTLAEGIDQFLGSMQEAAKRISLNHERVHATSEQLFPAAPS